MLTRRYINLHIPLYDSLHVIVFLLEFIIGFLTLLSLVDESVRAYLKHFLKTLFFLKKLEN